MVSQNSIGSFNSKSIYYVSSPLFAHENLFCTTFRINISTFYCVETQFDDVVVINFESISSPKYLRINRNNWIYFLLKNILFVAATSFRLKLFFFLYLFCSFLNSITHMTDFFFTHIFSITFIFCIYVYIKWFDVFFLHTIHWAYYFSLCIHNLSLSVVFVYWMNKCHTHTNSCQKKVVHCFYFYMIPPFLSRSLSVFLLFFRLPCRYHGRKLTYTLAWCSLML